MKKLNSIFYLFAFFMFLFFTTCKEEPPYINFNKPYVTYDTTYLISPVPPAQIKEILIEDVSGVSCVNCPQAADIAHNITIANSGRVNTVTIYPNMSLGGLTNPLINKSGVTSKYDFRTNDGLDIINLVCVPGSLPMGYIDRKLFTGNTTWCEPKENWNVDVNSELTATTPVNIDISTDLTSKSVTITLTYTQARSDSNYIHIMLVQDSIIDAQESKDVNNSTIYDSTFVHNHNLMQMLTSHTGDLINSSAAKSLVAGRVIKTRYNLGLNARNSSPSSFPQPPWDTKHLSVLVFVTEGTATKYVLQSKSAVVQ